MSDDNENVIVFPGPDFGEMSPAAMLERIARARPEMVRALVVAYTEGGGTALYTSVSENNAIISDLERAKHIVLMNELDVEVGPEG